jgi:hypothetical protein
MSDPLPAPAASNRFERIKRVHQAGAEFWSARDLARVLEYLNFRNFQPVIEKAREACAKSGYTVADHFAEMRNMVDIGSGAQRPVEDWALSRYACYLVIQKTTDNRTATRGGELSAAANTRLAAAKQILLRFTLARQARAKIGSQFPLFMATTDEREWTRSVVYGPWSALCHLPSANRFSAFAKPRFGLSQFLLCLLALRSPPLSVDCWMLNVCPLVLISNFQFRIFNFQFPILDCGAPEWPPPRQPNPRPVSDDTTKSAVRLSPGLHSVPSRSAHGWQCSLATCSRAALCPPFFNFSFFIFN